MKKIIESSSTLVTPDIAQQWLQRNKNNRPLSKNHVGFLAAAMKRGEWRFNGETISFFQNGDLADGQHRLAAIIKSSLSQTLLVVHGVEPESFVTINQGKRRTASDVLSISGEKNTTHLAAAARAYLVYHLKGRAANDITASQIINCIEEHPHIRLWSTRRSNDRTLKLFPSAIVSFSAIASEKYGTERIGQFLNQLSTGTDLEPGCPALLLRERLLHQKNSLLKTSVQNAFILKAINAHIMGKKLSFLRWSPAEDFPALV